MTQIDSLKRRNMVLGLLAVLLFAFLVFRTSATSAVTSESLPRLFPDLEVGAARTVILEREGGGAEAPKVRIQRAGEAGWVLTSSHGYPASADKVNRLLEDLQGTRRKKFITKRADTFGAYAGTDGWIHVQVLGEGGSTLADLYVGKSAGWPDSFARVQEDGKSVVVRAYNLSGVDMKLGADAWTEARIWPGLTLPSIERIDVHQRDEKSVLSFVREEQTVEPEEGAPEDAKPQTEQVWKMVAPKPGEPEKLKVEGLIRTLSGMRFEKVAARVTGTPDDAAHGFEQPAYRIAAFGPEPTVPGERPKFVLLVGNVVPAQAEGETSDRFYVRRVDDEWVFEVTAASVGDFRQQPAAYLPPPPVVEEPVEPSQPGDAIGSPDDQDDPDAPPPLGDLPPMPPDEPSED